MTDKTQPIDVETVPQQPTQALAVRQTGGAVGILRPADTLDAIAEAFKQYQAVCERILTPEDYQKYEGKPRKKKSAWRKLATAFNVSSLVVSKEIQRNEAGQVLSAQFTIRAYTGPKDSPWRQIEAEGYCDVHEKCCAASRGEKCHKVSWSKHYCCTRGCDGRRHFSHPDHDVIVTAQTRATNRAIADLIGCGEVSAEELTDDASPPTPPAQPTPPGRAGKPAPVSSPSPAAKSPAKEAPAGAPVHINWFLQELDDIRDLAREFFTKLTDPCPLMPNEQLSDLPAWALPSLEEFKRLRGAIMAFGEGEQAGWPYKPRREADPAPKAAIPPKSKPAAAPAPVDTHEPPGGWQGATGGGDPEPEPDLPALRGTIESVSLKEGKSAKGPWSLWGIKINGEWVNTFSNTIGRMAKAHKGQPVTLYYAEDGDRRKAVELVLADGSRHKTDD